LPSLQAETGPQPGRRQVKVRSPAKGASPAPHDDLTTCCRLSGSPGSRRRSRARRRAPRSPSRRLKLTSAVEEGQPHFAHAASTSASLTRPRPVKEPEGLARSRSLSGVEHLWRGLLSVAAVPRIGTRLAGDSGRTESPRVYRITPRRTAPGLRQERAHESCRVERKKVSVFPPPPTNRDRDVQGVLDAKTIPPLAVESSFVSKISGQATVHEIPSPEPGHLPGVASRTKKTLVLPGQRRSMTRRILASSVHQARLGVEAASGIGDGPGPHGGDGCVEGVVDYGRRIGAGGVRDELAARTIGPDAELIDAAARNVSAAARSTELPRRRYRWYHASLPIVVGLAGSIDTDHQDYGRRSAMARWDPTRDRPGMRKRRELVANRGLAVEASFASARALDDLQSQKRRPRPRR